MKTKFLNKLKYFDYGLFIPFTNFMLDRDRDGLFG